MRFAPLTYRIELFSGQSTHLVTGYAVELPAPFRGLRFCVRESAIHRGWSVDHYDSGHGFGGPIAAVGASAEQRAYCRRWSIDHTSRQRCAESLVRLLHHMHARGELRPLFERHGFGWCIDEAFMIKLQVPVVSFKLPKGVPAL